MTKRFTLFVCFVLSGLLFDVQWTWYSYHFEAACAESGNSVPGSWPLFTVLTLVPAGASLIFSANGRYILTCVVIWLFYVGLQLTLIVDAKQFESIVGVNCYRDVGSGTAVSFALALFFSAVIIAITLALGTAMLTRKLLRRAPPQTDQAPVSGDSATP